MKVAIWNIDGLAAKGMSWRTLIWRVKTNVLVLTELKALSTEVFRESWPRESVEVVPSSRKNVESAPRAGLAVVMRPGL